MDEVIDCWQHTKNLHPDTWNEAAPLIEEAAKYAHWEFTTQSVLESVLRGDQQLWTVYAGKELKFVWVTEIVQQADRRAVIVFAAAGEMDYGWKCWPWMSQWMRGNSISEAEVFCRPSMARLLKQRGLKTRYEVLTIEPVGENNVQ